MFKSYAGAYDHALTLATRFQTRYVVVTHSETHYSIMSQAEATRRALPNCSLVHPLG